MSYAGGVSNNNDWTECLLIVEKDWFTKETEKAYCFKLWKKKFLAFPKKLIQRYTEEGNHFTITMPKWFVEKHEVKYLMEKEVRELLFPKKVKPIKTQPLFDAELSSDRQPNIFPDKQEQANEFARKVNNNIPISINNDMPDWW